MEEKSLTYKKAGELSDTNLEFQKIIDYQYTGGKEKRRISLYFLVTISAFIFVIAFILGEMGYKISKNDKNDIPALVLSQFLTLNDDDIELKISEKFTALLFGVTKERSEAFFASESPDNENESIKDNVPTDLQNDSLQETLENPMKEPDNEKDVEEDFPKINILKKDLSGSALSENYISNETGYSPDIASLFNKKSSISKFDNKSKSPVVLIIHTHGTEAYTEEGVEYYIDDGSEMSRSRDKEKNVVAIGALMADVLNSRGISTLHCDIMHDEESYQDSYSRAAETIKSYLAKYPEIRYVFDVHRDAILTSDGSLVKTYTEIDGNELAQVMTVVGSDYKGAKFDTWEDNLSLALKLKSKIDSQYPGLSRPVYLRSAAYNLQYTKGSLLLEVGSSGNTLAEAKNAARYLANAIADVILDNNK